MRDSNSRKAPNVSFGRCKVRRVRAGDATPLPVKEGGYTWTTLPEDGYLVEPGNGTSLAFYIRDSDLDTANGAK